MHSKSIVQKALELLIQTGELGNTDSQKLVALMQHLDEQATISKMEAIAILSPQSKDHDAYFRNYVSRLRGAIETAAENCDNPYKREVFQSLSVVVTKPTATQQSRVAFDARLPKEELQTVKPNANYDKNFFIEQQGVNENELKLFISYASKDAKDAVLFQECLDEVAKNDEVVQWNMRKLVVGIDFDQQIKEQLKACHYGIALLSTRFFKSEYIKTVELKSFFENGNLIPVGFKNTLPTYRKYLEADTEQLKKLQIFYLDDRGQKDFFDQMHTKEARMSFVRQLLDAVKTRHAYEQQKRAKRAPETPILSSCRPVDYNPRTYIASNGMRCEIKDDLQKTPDRTDERDETYDIKNRVSIQHDLFSWATGMDEERPVALYALLGEYGMGKTFNCRMFAQKLHEARRDNPAPPFAVYIDLRDIDTFVQEERISRLPYVEEIIAQTLRLSRHGDHTADEIVTLNREGKLIIIFDGLDEKLVHYTKDMQSRYLTELLNILDIEQFPKQKILLSCRTHYFENISRQNSFFTGHSRNGLSYRNYRAVDILPLGEEEIRALVTKQIGKAAAQQVITLATHEDYLKSICSRPYMLSKVTAILPTLLSMAQNGQPINTKTFYDALIEDTLNRDNEKHTISMRHKKVLLQAIAAEMHRRSVQTMTVDALNDWFNAFILEAPIFKQYVIKEDFEVLERDLRNSTLLVRFGENHFGFSHASIYEYFLSLHLLEHWQKYPVQSRFSELTAAFALDAVALTDFPKEHFLPHLAKTLKGPSGALTPLALRLLARLDAPVETIRLGDIDLKDFRFENLRCKALHLHNAQLNRAVMDRCRIACLGVEASTLNEMLFMHCDLPQITVDAQTTTAQITSFHSTLGWPARPPFYHEGQCREQLRHKVRRWEWGHTGSVRFVALSGNGRTLVSGSDDKSVKIWDAVTGELRHTLSDHVGWVRSVALSADGRILVSGSDDGAIHRYAASSMTRILTFRAGGSEWASLEWQTGRLVGTPLSWRLGYVSDGEEGACVPLDRAAGYVAVAYGSSLS